jgi:hypothetical protein
MVGEYGRFRRLLYLRPWVSESARAVGFTSPLPTPVSGLGVITPERKGSATREERSSGGCPATTFVWCGEDLPETYLWRRISTGLILDSEIETYHRSTILVAISCFPFSSTIFKSQRYSYSNYIALIWDYMFRLDDIFYNLQSCCPAFVDARLRNHIPV